MENKKLNELLEAIKAKRKAVKAPVAPAKVEEKKVEAVKAPIAEAVKPVHNPGEKAVEHKPAASNKDVIKGQHAETLKAPIIESEELGSAAAQPVHNPGEKEVEYNPEVKQVEVHAGEQKAEEVLAPVTEDFKDTMRKVGQGVKNFSTVAGKAVGGAIKGGLSGAAGGAAVGAVTGGPAGAIGGALLGGAAGAVGGGISGASKGLYKAGEQTKADDIKYKNPKLKLAEDSHEGIPEEKQEELADKGELDYEGDMALSQIRTIIDAAVELNDMLEGNNDANLPEWVQSKMTLAKDYIDTVRDYMKSEKQEDEEESFSKEEVMEVMESLNLDTHKYTFEYLAEQIGFKKVKKIKKEMKKADPAAEVKPVEVKPAMVKESEQLGDAAAKPVATSDVKPVEHTPAVENKDVIKGQHAEEVKEVIVEAAKVKKAPLKVKINPKKNVIVDKKGQLSQAAPSVTPAAAVVTPAAPAKEGK